MGCCEPCACVCRLALLLVLAVATACSVMAIIECDFMYYEEIKVGLYTYTGLNSTCQEYNSEFPFTSGENTARYCGALAVAIGGATFILLAWETIFCDFPFGKVLESLGCTAALVCQGLTFVFLESPFCTSAGVVDDVRNIDSLEDVKDLWNNLYNSAIDGACEFGNAAYFSMVATGLFGIAMIMACTTTRPEPFCGK